MRRIANLNPYKNYASLIEPTYPFNSTLHNGVPSQDPREQGIFTVLLRWFMFTKQIFNLFATLCHTGLSVHDDRQGS